MFCKYQYKANSTLKNIHADIKALLTGQTNKSALSTDCDQANTVLVTTTPAGWVADTSGFHTPYEVTMPVSGSYNATPVSDGVKILWPVLGTNKILSSTDNGETWTPITLPQTLATFTPSGGAVVNLVRAAGLWVLTNPGVSSNWLLTSPDGITWTSVTTATSQQWGTPVWSGSLWVLHSLNPTQAICTSADGITWTYQATALPAANYWGVPIFANGVWLCAVGNVANQVPTPVAYVATSVDGIAWTSRTIPSYVTYQPTLINGVFFISSHFSATCTTTLSSTDGIAWTTSATVIGQTYNKITYLNGLYFLCSRSPLAVTTYLYTSIDGIAWMLRLTASYLNGVTYDSANGYWVAWTGQSTIMLYKSVDGVIWNNIVYGFSYGTSTPVNLLIVNNAYYLLQTTSLPYFVSYDAGLTFEERPVSPFTSAAGFNVLDCPLLISDNVYFLGCRTANSTKASFIKYNGTAAVLKSLNDDGVSYKKVFLDFSARVALLRSAEDFGVSTQTNAVYDSGKTTLGQQFDLVNGGLLYVSASSGHILLFSYIPSTNSYGSLTGNGFTAIFEYSRDDAWSINPYPSHVCLNSYILMSTSISYSPRLKSSALVDVTGSLAKLIPYFTNPFPKQVLNATGVTVLPVTDMRVNNFSTLTYGVLGGILKGGVKQSAASTGSNGDEVSISGVNHLVIAQTTFRWVVPIS